MFKLKYVSQTTQDPTLTRLEDSAITYVKTLEEIQGSNKVLYAGLKAVAVLMDTLPSFDSEVSGIKKLHASSFGQTEAILRDYYLCAVDLVDVLDTEINTMSEVDRLYKMLYQRYALGNMNDLLIKNRVFNNENYKQLCSQVVMAKEKFGMLNEKRLKIVNDLVAQMNNLLALEKALVNASLRAGNISRYDMTFNMQHVERVVSNIKEYLHVFEDALKRLGKHHSRLEYLQDSLDKLMHAYQKTHAGDPNFYTSTTPIYGYADLGKTYQKVMRALNLETENLKKEIEYMNQKERRLAQKQKLVVLPQRLAGSLDTEMSLLTSALDRRRELAMMHHPKIVGLASELKTIKDKMGKKLKQTEVWVTQIGDCIKSADEDMGRCVRHLSACQKNDLTKVQEHIEYVKLQQQLGKDKLRLSKLLLFLYRELNRIVRLRELGELDQQQAVHQKQIMGAIAKQMSARQELEANTRALTQLRETFAQTLKENEKYAEKGLNKSMEKLLELQSRNIDLAREMSKQNEEFAKEVQMQVAQGQNLEDAKDKIKEEIKHRVHGHLKEGTEDVVSPSGEFLGKAKEFVPGKLSHIFDEGSKQAFTQAGGMKPDQYAEYVHQILKNKLRGGARSAIASLKRKQSGGAHLVNIFAKGQSMRSLLKIIEQQIEDERRKLYYKLVRGSPDYELEKLRVDLTLYKVREELVEEQLGKLGAEDAEEKLKGQIENEYVLNVMMSDINAYRKLKDLVNESVQLYRLQNGLVRQVFAKVVRKVPEEKRGGLQEANNVLGQKIRAMEEMVDEVNAFCKSDAIKAYTLLRNPNDENFKAVGAAVVQCGNKLKNVADYSVDLSKATQSLLQDMDTLHEEIATKNIKTTLEKYNVQNPASSMLLIQKAKELVPGVAQAIREFIDDYIKLGNLLESHTREGQILDPNGKNLEYLQSDLNTITQRIRTAENELTGPLNDVKNLTNSVREVLKKFSTTPKEDKNERVKMMLDVNTKLKQRVIAVERLANVLDNLEGLLAKQRQLLEDVSTIKMKHDAAMIRLVNSMTITMFASAHEVKEKLIGLMAIRDILVQNQGRGNRMLDMTAEMVNSAANNLLEVWVKVKENLQNLQRPQAGGMHKQYGGQDNGKIGKALANVEASINKLKKTIDGDQTKVRELVKQTRNLKSNLVIDEYLKYDKELAQPEPEYQKIVGEHAVQLLKVHGQKDNLDDVLKEVENAVDKGVDGAYLKEAGEQLYKKSTSMYLLSFIAYGLLVATQMAGMRYKLQALNALLCAGETPSTACSSAKGKVNVVIGQLRMCENKLGGMLVSSVLPAVNQITRGIVGTEHVKKIWGADSRFLKMLTQFQKDYENCRNHMQNLKTELNKLKELPNSATNLIGTMSFDAFDYTSVIDENDMSNLLLQMTREGDVLSNANEVYSKLKNVVVNIATNVVQVMEIDKQTLEGLQNGATAVVDKSEASTESKDSMKRQLQNLSKYSTNLDQHISKINELISKLQGQEKLTDKQLALMEVLGPEVAHVKGTMDMALGGYQRLLVNPALRPKLAPGHVLGGLEIVSVFGQFGGRRRRKK